MERSEPFAWLYRGLVRSGGAGWSLSHAFLDEKRLCNHVNKEQDVALEVENVYEICSFLMRMRDPGKMIS